MAGKTIMFIGGGTETIAAVQLARQMGLHVVVSDANPDAPAMSLAHDRLVASTYDISATVRAARDYRNRHRLDGVICAATDVPLTVATVAQELGLPGIPVEAAQLSQDKVAMKERFLSAGVPIPRFVGIDSAEHLRSIMSEWKVPGVLKPVDSRGARGVLRLDGKTDLTWAFGESMRNSPTGRVMLEEFMPGPQISSESFVLDGVAYTPGFADRNYEFLDRFAPYIIENGGDLPSRIDHETRVQLNQVIEMAAASIGVSHGVIKGDIVVTDGRVHVIEVATRLSGGYFSSHEIPFNTGVNFIGFALRLALGEPVDPRALTPTSDRPIVSRYFFPEPGTVTAIYGRERFQAHPNILHLEIRVGIGDQVRAVDSHPARAGVVMTTGETRDAAIALAQNVVKGIRIETTGLR